MALTRGERFDRTVTPPTRRLRRTSQRALIALTLSVGAAGAALSSASSLTLSGNRLGAGTTVIASCDTDGVTVSYTNAFDVPTGRYRTSAATVKGINSACNAKRLQITVKQTTGASLGAQTIATLALSGATTQATVNFTPTIDSALISGAAIVIAG